MKQMTVVCQQKSLMTHDNLNWYDKWQVYRFTFQASEDIIYLNNIMASSLLTVQQLQKWSNMHVKQLLELRHVSFKAF